MTKIPMGQPSAEPSPPTGAAAEQPAASAGESRSALWFHRRATYYVEAQVLFHLNQVGVFSLLARGSAYSAAALAAELGLKERVLAVLLDYVFAVDELLLRSREGQYSLSAMGQAVVQRFSHSGPDQEKRINFFDVRVGGYGPVWASLDQLLTGTGEYGRDFRRNGSYAEGGVRKLAMHFWPVINQLLGELPIAQVLEVGLTTGIIEQIGVRYPQLALFGLDRSAAAIAHAGERAASLQVSHISWLQADLFQVATWRPAIKVAAPGMLFSLHFHELLAAGQAPFINWLQHLRAEVPGWYVVALEQPRLLPSERETTTEAQWLYAQSNVLIHHLIGNGSILSRAEWAELGEKAGCRLVSDRACDYLGYRAFVFQL